MYFCLLNRFIYVSNLIGISISYLNADQRHTKHDLVKFPSFHCIIHSNVDVIYFIKARYSRNQ